MVGSFINFVAFLSFLSASAVISIRNPVHSILFLVLSFFMGGVLLIAIGAEFLGLIVLVVQVGAIAVLFLFVVMMLNINVESKNSDSSLFLVGFGVVLFVLGVLLYLLPIQISVDPIAYFEYQSFDWSFLFDSITTLETLGQFLQTDFFILFLVAGLILLIALVGAVVLTLQVRGGVKKQYVHLQRSRSFESSVFKVS